MQAQSNQYSDHSDVNEAKRNKNETSNSAATAISSLVAVNPTFEVRDEHCYSTSNSPLFTCLQKILNLAQIIRNLVLEDLLLLTKVKSQHHQTSSAKPEHTILAQLPISPLFYKEISRHMQSESVLGVVLLLIAMR